MVKNLLIIGFVWPEPKSSAAGSRMMQLIEAFKSFGYDITFTSACAKTDNAFDLKSIGVQTETIQLNHSSFDDFVKQLQPDAVLFDRFMTEEQFGWRVAEHCPNALRILDTEDLHCLRKGRQQAFKDGKPFDDSYLYNDYAMREIASIYRSDLSLIISLDELSILGGEFQIDHDLLLYLPFMLDAIQSETTKHYPKFEQRQHFISIGNFLHEPNYNAVLYLKETIWPLIRKQLPTAELHIYGAYVNQKASQLHNANDGFLVKGFVDDVSMAMQNTKVCLAPLRFGAGLKGKLIDAMQNGTPCVMTSIAAEGMFNSDSPHPYVSDDPQEFADNAVALYQNPSLWNDCQAYGYDVINTSFDKVTFQKDLFSKVETISQNLKEHRYHNFIGQLLQHHTLQSTKYMSKWIEAKNS
jgi:glycosyltransferase involved in cell wall biosynthesis